MNTSYVTASELGEYIYCECCWMDTLENGKEPTLEMERGIEKHEKVSSNLELFRRIRIVCLLVIGLIIISVFLIHVVLRKFGIQIW